MSLQAPTYLFLIIVFFTSCNMPQEVTHQNNANESNNPNAVQYAFFDEEKNPLQPAFELLPSGSTKPKGWLYKLMKEDITSGFVAYLDELVPDLMKEDDLFNTERRLDTTYIPDVGNQILTGAAWEISMQWWAGESLGNWWDGYIRNAYLTEDTVAMRRSVEIVEYLLATQDKDGYFGIYGPDLRFNHKGSNGELWTKTTVFRMLLGYYEMTGDERALKMVINDMDNTMQYYNKGIKSPFDVSMDYGGVSHGLMLTDVCEMLYRITGDIKYSDYAVFLYEDFSEYPINRAFNDACYGFLMEKDSLFQSHSAHTYEHLRSVIQTRYATGFPEMEKAYQNALSKLSNCILPSGAGFGNEWLNKEIANPETTGAEVCGMNELKDFYLSALQKTGKSQFGDSVEKLSFNALMGARDHRGSAITYCKTDNCYILNNKSPQTGFEEFDFRYKYSPTHADAAVCCNPSYSKFFPYYLANMWMAKGDGLAAVLYGPSILQTSWKDQEISIEQNTNYPFSDKIVFTISTSQPVFLPLYFRIPSWSDSISLDAGGAETQIENGYYKVQKEWKDGDRVSIRFDNEIKIQSYHNGEIFFQRGPLLYVLEIPHNIENIRKYELEDFKDYFCLTTSELYKQIIFDLQSEDIIQGFSIPELDELDNPWYRDDIFLSVKAKNKGNGEDLDLKMVPMGNTFLRRVTFPVEH